MLPNRILCVSFQKVFYPTDVDKERLREARRRRRGDIGYQNISDDSLTVSYSAQ